MIGCLSELDPSTGAIVHRIDPMNFRSIIAAGLIPADGFITPPVEAPRVDAKVQPVIQARLVAAMASSFRCGNEAPVSPRIIVALHGMTLFNASTAGKIDGRSRAFTTKIALISAAWPCLQSRLWSLAALHARGFARLRRGGQGRLSPVISVCSSWATHGGRGPPEALAEPSSAMFSGWRGSWPAPAVWSRVRMPLSYRAALVPGGASDARLILTGQRGDINAVDNIPMLGPVARPYVAPGNPPPTRCSSWSRI